MTLINNNTYNDIIIILWNLIGFKDCYVMCEDILSQMEGMCFKNM